MVIILFAVLPLLILLPAKYFFSQKNYIVQVAVFYLSLVLAFLLIYLSVEYDGIIGAEIFLLPFFMPLLVAFFYKDSDEYEYVAKRSDKIKYTIYLVIAFLFFGVAVVKELLTVVIPI